MLASYRRTRAMLISAAAGLCMLGPAPATGQSGQPCYANCDGSAAQPLLTVDDFTCFINQFAIGLALPHEQQVAHYANCDGSIVAPVLNVDDFVCFINEFAMGCAVRSPGGGTTQGGCPQEPCDPPPTPPPQPAPKQIPLKVWRVFAVYDQGLPGEYNRGCRLYDGQVQQFIGDLQSTAHIFGNVQFTWDQVIQDVTDSEIPNSVLIPRTVAVDQWLSSNRLIWQAGTWDSSRINIYFVGNLQDTVQTQWFPQKHSAEAVPPGYGSFSNGPPPQIFVNDGGGPGVFAFQQGWSPDDRTTNPGNAGYNEMAHEMAHYLGRFAETHQFQPHTGSVYFDARPNETDHTHDWSTYPLYPNNVLRYGGTGFDPDPAYNRPPFPLVVPGNVNDLNTEKGVIWRRIDDGSWNLP